MAKSERLYVGKSVVSAWTRASGSSAQTVLAFSPYVTSETAERVLYRHGDVKGRCTLYTLFDAEVFVNGSSTLGTLRRLLRAGVRLYALDDLHAKMVVVPGKV